MLLKVKGLTKYFGGLAAVSDVDFNIEQGMIFGLIGPNGAGKTTIFNLLSGSIDPTKGSIVFNGKEIASLKPHQICHRGLCRTYQVTRPFSNMTVLDNVKVGVCFGRGKGKLQGKPNEEAMQILELMQLAGKANQFAKNLTIADRKRLEISRALATSPDLLLLDEVVSGLNPTETSVLMESIRRIREKGTTILLIEHVMQAIMGLSDRIMVLNYGRRIAEGKPEDVSANPLVIEAYLGTGDKKCLI